MTIRDALARQGLDSVIFHSNGVGGPAMEELAADGLFVGVIDFTTDELTDELVGGFHVGGPERLRRIGRLGLPQVVVPGCIDFSVHGRPEEVPARLQGRPIYTHNPEFTLVRTLPDEMVAARAHLRRAAERRDRPDRGDGADRGPLDSERARAARSGTRRPTPASSPSLRAHLRAGHPDLDARRCTSTRPSSRSPWPSASSRCSRRKERPHDRARARASCRRNNMADLAYPDIQAYLKVCDLVLVPMASTEQHGPHLPLCTDTVTAIEVASRVAQDQQHAAHAGDLDRLLAAAHGRPGRGPRHDHHPLVDAAGADVRRRAQPDPPRLQQDPLHQRPRLERQGGRSGAAQDPLRHRRAWSASASPTWSATPACSKG